MLRLNPILQQTSEDAVVRNKAIYLALTAVCRPFSAVLWRALRNNCLARTR